METFPLTVYTDVDTSHAPQITKAQFGDGYAQRVASGINNAPRTWQVPLSVSKADHDTVNSFLLARGGYDPFFWTPPGASSPVVVVCEKWSVSQLAGATIQRLSMEFQEVFGY